MKFREIKYDDLVKSPFIPGFVIPAKAGIQCFQSVKTSWTPVFTGVTTFYNSIKYNKLKITCPF
ncbi:MAG: hypothetical protein FJ123_20415 [Deltaproteobacteria bacterium]|nr:hypothetical protein [Deltaproteobacteria bacterium]